MAGRPVPRLETPGTITIVKSVQRIGGQVVVTDPKTPSGRRVVTLPPVAVVALLRQWQERQSETLVFTGARGGPLHVSVVEHALGRECRRLGIPVVTPRSLRHLHASLLLG
ncbi:MAG: hypothetical protein FJZ90_06910, partial [Chloroflexi bacterium]|nr:hypothetical protein [Chloroflexota bacterium]